MITEDGWLIEMMRRQEQADEMRREAE